MESRGFELVADKFRFPRLIFKVPYDRIGAETLAFDKKKALSLLANNLDYEELIRQILARVAKNPCKAPEKT